ncbi:MAG: DUF5519 family protein [Acidimicrobiia bacterium]|nr:DUF5519 family protein [Acidimicrobiia bacterium]
MTERGLQRRPGPRPRTHNAPPHTQIDAEPVPELIAELASRCFALPHVAEAPTRISVPGARALVATPIAPFDTTKAMIGREFAHIHPDGSMHLVIPPETAKEAIDAGWVEPHPMAKFFNPGAVMVYTPRDPAELEVTWKLVQASHTYVMTTLPHCRPRLMES